MNRNEWNNDDNDWFFKNFEQGGKKAAKTVGLLWLVGIVLNVAFWGGLIWFVFFLLNHYGVI